MGEPRIIRNTTVAARHPWPDDIVVQGGAIGLVLSSGGDEDYVTAFVEVFPGGTFLRGEGPTVTDAENACWVKYRAYLRCAGSDSGRHGPYEARNYENGAGFCVRCGVWFTQEVTGLPKSESYLRDEAELAAMQAEVRATFPPEQQEYEILRRLQARLEARIAARLAARRDAS